MSIKCRVSVVMAAYNVAPYVEEAVNSILQQTYTDFELIVIDDDSADSTWEVLERLAAQDGRMHIERNPENIGIANTRNRGTELARGEFIAVMDSDDIATSDRLTKQVAYLDTHPKIGAVGGTIQLSSSREDLSDVLWTYPRTPNLVRWQVCFGAPLPHAASMIRRSELIQVSGYRPEYTLAEDYDLWQRLSQVTDLANLPDLFLYYRQHTTNITLSRRQMMQQRTAEISGRAIEQSVGVRLTLAETIQLHGGAVASPGSTVHLARTLAQLADHFKRTSNLASTEWTIIRKDAARRILRLARHKPRSRETLAALYYAFQLDPAGTAQWSGILAKRATRHRLHTGLRQV